MDAIEMNSISKYRTAVWNLITVLEQGWNYWPKVAELKKLDDEIFGNASHQADPTDGIKPEPQQITDLSNTIEFKDEWED